ncbi:MAG: hypothetical protein HY309_04960 [Pseudomonas fluorescens]|nr:hypothetical protein [Pseudomonas fluorescens]
MLLTPNAMSRRMRFGLYATTGLIGLFLLLPIVFIVLLSFGSSQWLVFPPPGWTLKWYGQFFSNADWMNAAMASLKVAVLTTFFAVALGLPTAFALVRGRFPGREMLYGLFTLPMIVAFLVSWDEVVLSVMMASPTLQTLPVKMWTTLRQDLTPVIAVASTLLIGLSVLVMVIAAALRRRNEISA